MPRALQFCLALALAALAASAAPAAGPLKTVEGEVFRVDYWPGGSFVTVVLADQSDRGYDVVAGTGHTLTAGGQAVDVPELLKWLAEVPGGQANRVTLGIDENSYVGVRTAAFTRVARKKGSVRPAAMAYGPEALAAARAAGVPVVLFGGTARPRPVAGAVYCHAPDQPPGVYVSATADPAQLSARLPAAATDAEVAAAVARSKAGVVLRAAPPPPPPAASGGLRGTLFGGS